MRKELREVGRDVAGLRQILVESTPDRGSVLDEQRKHRAQIQELQGASWPVFVAKTFTACVIGLATTFAAGLLAKGLILEIITQATKMPHP